MKKGAYVHFFAGASRGKAFKEAVGRFELLEVDRQEDLTSPATWMFLLELAASGRLLGIFGGPPCRTYIFCRHFPPGPLPVQAPDFWHGLPDLSPYEQEQVWYDDGLVLRMLVLFEVSCFVCDVEPFFAPKALNPTPPKHP